MKAKEKKSVQILEQLLNDSNKVLAIPFTKENEKMLFRVYDMLMSILERYKVLLLTDIQIREKASDRVCIIPVDEMKEILKIYNTYEFSDKFILFSQAALPYGGLTNYVKLGFMTEEECFYVLIGDRDG